MSAIVFSLDAERAKRRPATTHAALTPPKPKPIWRTPILRSDDGLHPADQEAIRLFVEQLNNDNPTKP